MLPSTMGNFKGACSEAIFLTECLKRNWEITKPFSDIYHYDFVIRRPGLTWETVQVKTAYTDYCGSSSERLVVSLRKRSNGKNIPYGADDFNLLCAVHPSSSRIWIVPFLCIEHLASSLSLRGCEPFLLGENDPDLKDIQKLTKHLKEIPRPNARLTKSIANQMIELHKSGTTQKEIATKLEFSKSAVARVIRGEALPKV